MAGTSKKHKMAPVSTIRMADVAKRAGVSLTTVGQVLLRSGGKNVRVSDKTAKLVMQVAEELNYKPNRVAQQLAGKGSKIIAVFIDLSAAPVSQKRLNNIEILAQRHGYRLMIGHPMCNPQYIEEYISDFTARGVDGLICIHHAYPGKEDLVPRLVSRLPHVVFIKKPALDDSNYVDMDEADGTRQIIAHLCQRNHTRIAIALTDDQWPGNKQRIKGYKEELQKQNIVFDPSLLWLDGDHHVSEQQADKIISDLVLQKKATAIVTMNDYWAARIINCLKRRHFRIPQDVAVASYDNLDISTYIDPAITTLDPRHDDVAQAAMEMLFKLINHEPMQDRDKVAIIKPGLIIRSST